MSRDYTMEDFHTEMRRRGVRADDPPQIAAPTATQVPDGAVTRVVRCGVHPLHFVKVSASGARSGCPMCEGQLEDGRSSGPASHAPQITQDRTRIVGCTCGWRTPPGTTDSDDAYAAHYAAHCAADSTIARKETQMTKKQNESVFNGVKVFSATMIAQRQTLGETVTAWLEDARATRPGFQIVDTVVSQSSDNAFHCIAITIFYNEDLPSTPKARRG